MNITPISLIVGLGNPGAEYDGTRHNAGADFVKVLVHSHFLTFKLESKFQGFYARLQNSQHDCHFLIPTTYMNNSGQSVQALAHFLKIPSERILVAHDDLDLPPGVIRLRHNGGHGGHNGLRDIIDHLGTKEFYRLRIGIGHPGDKTQVTHYVLKKAPLLDQERIDDAMDDTLRIVPDLLAGNIQNAMQTLHTQPQREDSNYGI